MTSAREQKALHDVFLVSVWIKGAVGLIQALAGLALLVVTQHALVRAVMAVTTPELSEDPRDPVAMFLRNSAQHWGAGTQHFASVYLVMHGVIKLALVIALLRRKLWSYPVSLWVLGAFIAYQCYRYTLTHSFWLVLLTALDISVVALVWHEYRLMRRMKPAVPWQ